MNGFFAIASLVIMFAIGSTLLKIPTQQTTPIVTIAPNREVSFTVPERSGTQYIRAYAVNNDKYIHCYFNTIPNYNGKCTRAHESQFQYYVEYLDNTGVVLAKFGPMQVTIQPTIVIPTFTPIPTATPIGRAILPIIIR